MGKLIYWANPLTLAKVSTEHHSATLGPHQALFDVAPSAAKDTRGCSSPSAGTRLHTAPARAYSSARMLPMVSASSGPLSSR